MAIETVVGQYAAQVGVVGKENAKEVVNLALKPVCPGHSAVTDGTLVVSEAYILTRTHVLYRSKSKLYTISKQCAREG